MKKNIVGFFEGGDSDMSSSDEEHAYDAVTHAELELPMLQGIIEAVKAASPPVRLDSLWGPRLTSFR